MNFVVLSRSGLAIVIIRHFIGRQLGPHTNNCQMYNFSCEYSYLPFNLWHGGK